MCAPFVRVDPAGVQVTKEESLVIWLALMLVGFIILEIPRTKVLLKAEVFIFQRRGALTDLFTTTSSCSALRFPT